MKRVALFLSLTAITAFIIFYSCRKEIDKNETLMEALASAMGGGGDQEDFFHNYILLRSSQRVNGLDSSFEIFAGANFSDNGISKNAGNLIINSRNIPINNSSTSYDFRYEGPAYNEGKILPGTNVLMGITGSNDIEAISRSIYVPQNIVISTLDFPRTFLRKNQNLNLRWLPDPNNIFGKAFIEVYYYQSLSQLNDPAFPNSIQSVQYTVNDNGNFTIPSGDLQRFPQNSYVGVAIGRGTVVIDYTNNTRRKVYFYTISDCKTSPLLVSQ
jgi:hypothetical protein